MHFSTLASVVVITLVPSISGHCLFLSASGDKTETSGTDNGWTGWTRGLGWREAVPRTDGYQFPSQWDVPVFATIAVPPAHEGPAITDKRYYVGSGCGVTLHNIAKYQEKKEPDYAPETPAVNAYRNTHYFQKWAPTEGYVDVPWEIWQQAQKKQITQATAGGYLRMYLHTINDDGVGPFRCKLDMTGTAKRGDWGWDTNEQKKKDNDWDGWLTVNQTGVPQEDPAQVATRGRSVTFLHGGPRGSIMYAQLPKNLNCKGETLNGEIKDLCLIRCENLASNGPFGGCLFFQQYRPPKKEKYKPKAPKKQTPPKKVKPPKGYKDETEYANADELPQAYYKKRQVESAPKLRFKRD
ncbi:hypothetical protein TWF281_007208 [Arthrobotrys megalospora]